MGYPSYARNRACELSSPSPFHYVMAKIVPAVQLARMLKVAPCTDARTVVSPDFIGLMGYCVLLVGKGIIFRVLLGLSKFHLYPFSSGKSHL